MIAIQERLDRAINQLPWVESLADQVQSIVRQIFKIPDEQQGRAIRDALNGVWLGHPLHPAMTDFTVGAWTTSTVLDVAGAVTGDEFLNDCGDTVLAIGTASALGSALSGMADWSEVEGESRRVGLIHGLLNLTSFVAMLGSVIVRAQGGNRAVAMFLSLFGFGLSFVSADLGGELAYRLGTNVSREAFSEAPEDFADVLAEADLKEGELKKAEANGMPIVLARQNGQIYAIGGVCTHWGGPLWEGKLDGCDVVCPWHGTTFCLHDGHVQAGPGSLPATAFDVRVREGQIQVKRRV